MSSESFLPTRAPHNQPLILPPLHPNEDQECFPWSWDLTAYGFEGRFFFFSFRSEKIFFWFRVNDA